MKKVNVIDHFMFRQDMKPYKVGVKVRDHLFDCDFTLERIEIKREYIIYYFKSLKSKQFDTQFSAEMLAYLISTNQITLVK